MSGTPTPATTTTVAAAAAYSHGPLQLVVANPHHHADGDRAQ